MRTRLRHRAHVRWSSRSNAWRQQERWDRCRPSLRRRTTGKGRLDEPAPRMKATASPQRRRLLPRRRLPRIPPLLLSPWSSRCAPCSTESTCGASTRCRRIRNCWRIGSCGPTAGTQPHPDRDSSRPGPWRYKGAGVRGGIEEQRLTTSLIWVDLERGRSG